MAKRRKKKKTRAPAAQPPPVVAVGQVRNVLLVGCGGTGSILAEHLARMIAGFRLDATLALCDGDTVAEANVARQNFAPHEVGANKAEALALRLSGQFGLAIEARPKHFDLGWGDSKDGLIVTATDSLHSRRDVARRAWDWWLDVGNELHHGQAVLGNTCVDTHLHEVHARWAHSGVIGRLPNAAALNPAILRVERADTPAASCADQPFAVQGFGVNAMAALAAATLAKQLLVDRQVTIAGIWFNVADGRMTSRRITRDLFARWAKAPRQPRTRRRYGGCHIGGRR